MTAHAQNAAALVELHTALAVKMDGQPRMEPSLTVYQSGLCLICLTERDSYATLHFARGSSPGECIADARAFIAAMPDPDTAALRKWHTDLGKVIEGGEALALGPDVITPLRTVSEAVAGNLLAAPEAAQ